MWIFKPCKCKTWWQNHAIALTSAQKKVLCAYIFSLLEGLILDFESCHPPSSNSICKDAITCLSSWCSNWRDTFLINIKNSIRQQQEKWDATFEWNLLRGSLNFNFKFPISFLFFKGQINVIHPGFKFWKTDWTLCTVLRWNCLSNSTLSHQFWYQWCNRLSIFLKLYQLFDSIDSWCKTRQCSLQIVGSFCTVLEFHWRLIAWEVWFCLILFCCSLLRVFGSWQKAGKKAPLQRWPAPTVK